MSPNANVVYGSANCVWYVSSSGNAVDHNASQYIGVAPAIYLKSNVLFESGTGSETNPYILSMQ